jgi:hypothetical protein
MAEDEGFDRRDLVRKNDLDGKSKAVRGELHAYLNSRRCFKFHYIKSSDLWPI